MEERVGGVQGLRVEFVGRGVTLRRHLELGHLPERISGCLSNLRVLSSTIHVVTLRPEVNRRWPSWNFLRM